LDALNGALVCHRVLRADYPPKSLRTPALLPDQACASASTCAAASTGIGVKLSAPSEGPTTWRELEDRLRDEGGGDARVADARLVAEVFREDARAKVREFAGDTDVLREAPGDGAGALTYEIAPDWQREVRERAMQQVLEVLRNRVEDPAKGIAESVVTRQGDDRVLVQIPGGEVDRQAARALLEVTGFLEFAGATTPHPGAAPRQSGVCPRAARSR
jgi:preprotein translocase subunit SecD